MLTINRLSREYYSIKTDYCLYSIIRNGVDMFWSVYDYTLEVDTLCMISNDLDSCFDYIETRESFRQ